MAFASLNSNVSPHMSGQGLWDFEYHSKFQLIFVYRHLIKLFIKTAMAEPLGLVKEIVILKRVNIT